VTDHHNELRDLEILALHPVFLVSRVEYDVGYTM